MSRRCVWNCVTAGIIQQYLLSLSVLCCEAAYQRKTCGINGTGKSQETNTQSPEGIDGEGVDFQTLTGLGSWQLSAMRPMP